MSKCACDATGSLAAVWNTAGLIIASIDAAANPNANLIVRPAIRVAISSIISHQPRPSGLQAPPRAKRFKSGQEVNAVSAQMALRLSPPLYDSGRSRRFDRQMIVSLTQHAQCTRQELRATRSDLGNVWPRCIDLSPTEQARWRVCSNVGFGVSGAALVNS